MSQAYGRSDGIFPRTKKQSTGLFFARCGAPSCSNPRPSGDKKDPQPKLEVLLVGVTGFEPTASWSRTKRATNCATPRKENRSSQAAAVWLGMRGSNSHGRSQSPLHYHYANPHRILCLGRLPSTLIYYSVPRRICQRFFQKNFKIFKKSLSALHSLFLCFHGHLPANGLYCFS